MKAFATYYRVTKKPNKSYLASQQKGITTYADNTGKNEKVCFLEVTNGNKTETSALTAALAYCKANKCPLVIPRICRLTINQSVLNELHLSSIEFVVIGEPDLNKKTIKQFLPIAEYERQKLSERIESDLQEAKKRGVTLGNPNLHLVRVNNTKPAIQERQKRALNHMRVIRRAIADIEAEQGKMSVRKMAERLNEKGIQTRKGKEINHMTISRAKAA